MTYRFDEQGMRDKAHGVIQDVRLHMQGVVGIDLVGSRAVGNYRPDSDWDVAIHFGIGIAPQSVPDILREKWPNYHFLPQCFAYQMNEKPYIKLWRQS